MIVTKKKKKEKNAGNMKKLLIRSRLNIKIESNAHGDVYHFPFTMEFF